MTMQTLTRTWEDLERSAEKGADHRQYDPDNTCPKCMRVKARMRSAAKSASMPRTDRYGNTFVPRYGSPAWTRAYHDALELSA